MSRSATSLQNFKSQFRRRFVTDWLRPGQKVAFIAKLEGVLMVPVPNAKTWRDSARSQHGGLSRPKRSLLMRVVDTSVWIEWIVGSASARRSARSCRETDRGSFRRSFNTSFRAGLLGRCQTQRRLGRSPFQRIGRRASDDGHRDEGGRYAQSPQPRHGGRNHLRHR